MFYHVLTETIEKVGKSNNNREISELNRTDKNTIIDDILVPFLQQEMFQLNGHFLQPAQVKRLVVKQTELNADDVLEIAYKNISEGVICIITHEDALDNDKYSTDITKELMGCAKAKITAPVPETVAKPVVMDTGKVFIVHGHDEAMKVSVARFIERLGFDAIILHEQASAGMTIIEKIESYTNVGFGVVLYSPCDVGGKKADKPALRCRARQNVVFEHGYLIAKLQRQNVCALVKDDIETPNDISGVVYVPFDTNNGWQMVLCREMKKAGYQIDMNAL